MWHRKPPRLPRWRCDSPIITGGIHPWAVYALVGLSPAFFACNRGLPFTIVLLIMCCGLYRGLQKEDYHATIIGKMEPETHRIEIPVGKEESSNP